MPDSAATLMRRADRARREHRTADAQRDLVEAVALCRQTGERRELVQALKALGQIERDLGRGDAALPLYEEAVAICRAESDRLMLAHTVRHLGDTHQDAGRTDQAEPCYREALAIYRGTEDAHKLDFANAIRPLAILKSNAGQLEAAKPLWEEARELYRTVGVREGVAECSGWLADLEGRCHT